MGKNQPVGICDKCGKPVLMGNDATAVWVEAGLMNPMGILFRSARHFLPEGDCEGSPSRAQYIKGQPRDTRGYPYQPELEAKVRAAYKRLNAE